MRTLYGIDGCKSGWLVVSQASGDIAVTASLNHDIGSFSNQLAPDDIVVIDMPIGLPDADQPVRDCDRLARKVLGNRHVCVFSPPCREALCAPNRDAASAVNQPLGRKITQQTWAIRHKLQELDSFLRENPAMSGLFKEAHPEVSFAYWRQEAGNLPAPTPFDTPKKRSDGKRRRRDLIEATWPGALASVKTALETDHATGWAMDDLHDAFACLHTARRIARGNSRSLPDTNPPPRDAAGLYMVIHA
jgi:predicted RNase H-like nuclease